jgi:hypothetical protein
MDQYENSENMTTKLAKTYGIIGEVHEYPHVNDDLL